MIAEVDLRLYQCVAELVDNAFDELQAAAADVSDVEPRVDVTIPLPAKVNEQSVIEVADNGRGMSMEQLTDALRAGSSGNKRFGSLGLFGMGFNVATARLGRMTTVRSGRVGDEFWTVVQIDIDKMQESETFVAPVTRIPKDPQEHGTLVSVSRLRQDVRDRLRRPSELTTLRKTLGRIYSYMLRTPNDTISGARLMGGLGLDLFVNGKAVKPVWPCVWDPSRGVPYKGQSIPAFMQIDRPLKDAWACMDCGQWHAKQRDECTNCGSGNLELRERRVWGWIGIQRYIDSSDFGFTILRQGRAIVTRDTALFRWEASDGSSEQEYPVELGQGRIVGEIHIDHAPVNFRKTDFDRGSQAWDDMVQAIRGQAPLKPQSTKALGLEPNTSPLAQLFNGYRRHDPGTRCLIPGDGESALHAQAKAWAKEFAEGTPAYQSDQRWFDAAQEHLLKKSGQSTKANEAEDDDAWFAKEGLDASASVTDETSPSNSQQEGEAGAAPETDEQRFARYRASAHSLRELETNLRVGTTTTQFRAYMTDGVDLSRPGLGDSHFVMNLSKGITEAFIDKSHPLLADYGWSPFAAVMVCATPALQRLFNYRLGEFLVTEFMNQYPDQKVDQAAIRSRAESLLERTREALAPIIAERPEAYWNSITPEARMETEREASSQAPDIDWAASVQDGTYAPYLSVKAIRDLLEAHPADLLDGHVFSHAYQSWESEDPRREAVSRVTVLLDDLRAALTPPTPRSAMELNRLRLSVDILGDWVVQ